MDDGSAVIIALFALGMLILVIVALFIFIDSMDTNSGVAATATSSTSAAGVANKPQKKRVYTSGTRVEELLTWSALESTEALAAYLQQMEGDEREALFSHLPQVANCVLGLDHHGPSSARGWLNEQANLLSEPNRNVRAAQNLAQRLLDLLAAPARGGGPGAVVGGGGSLGGSGVASATMSASSPGAPGAAAGAGTNGSAASGFSSVLGSIAHTAGTSGPKTAPGILVEKLVDAGRGPEGGMRYTFFSRHLPPPSRLALTNGHLALLAPIFAARLHSLHGPGTPPAAAHGVGSPRGGAIEPPNLVLAAWEYFLFCFCLWPLSDGGERAMEVSTPPSGAAAALPGASRMLTMVAGDKATGEPLYITLLGSYLRHFLPVGAPAVPGGDLLMQALSQFWLCQNAPPLVAAQLAVSQPFQDTKACVLTCLNQVILHLNAHEAALVANMAAGASAAAVAAANVPLGVTGALGAGASAHALMMAPMYHFFERQLHSLPEISARVLALIRVFTAYLHPWGRPEDLKDSTSSAKPAASAPSASADAGGAAGEPFASAGASSAVGSAPAVSGSAAAAAAERWAWAGFVKRNYLLYVRLLVSVAREVRLNRFRIGEKRDMLMLRKAMALFDAPHVLTLMRHLGEALEQLLNNTLPATDPLRDVLVAQLVALEGADTSRWRPACEAYSPSKVYQALDGMDKELQNKLDEHRRRQAQKGFLEGAMEGAASVGTGSASTLVAHEELRRFAQRGMRELQPAGHTRQATPRAVATQVVRPDITLLGAAAGAEGFQRPLTDEQKSSVRRGHARCSALSVPFRATPRQPVRPVGAAELSTLVDWSERLAFKLPERLKRLGVHPRLLASVPSLCLCSVYAILLALRPTRKRLSADGELQAPPTLLTVLWWLLLLPTLAIGGLYLRHWARRHRPSEAAAAESWVPWLAEQLARGTKEDDLRDYLQRTLPPAPNEDEPSPQQVRAMLERAKERVARYE